MPAHWTTLSHNGVHFPPPYVPDGLRVKMRGQVVTLSPLAEEMAYHLAKKKDTDYVKDPVFTANFMSDFLKQLPEWCRGASYQDVDFSEPFAKVDAEKRAKEAMSREDKKRLAAERKLAREELKSRFGFATLDGDKVEIANWMVEPPGLFMGRGCISGDTIVMTPRGPKHIEEVTSGDLVASHHGSRKMLYRKVAVVAKQGVRPVFLLRTRTHSIRATENHPFLALRIDKARRKNSNGQLTGEKCRARLNWAPLSKLRRGDYVVVAGRYNTPGTTKFGNTPRRTYRGAIITPKFARVVGYYLGDGFTGKRSDGTNSHVSFSEGDPDLLEKYTRICLEVFGIKAASRPHNGSNSQVLSLYSREFADLIESMGVTGTALTKRVPGWVFGIADDLKHAFLRGYLDADGSYFVKEIRGIQYSSFGIESLNRRLVEDLRELSISAGLQVSNLTRQEKSGFTHSTVHRFFISECSSVNRLLGESESLRGSRTRSYALADRRGDLRNKRDWSNLEILDSPLYALESVLEIRTDGRAQTFDISMKDSRYSNFIANQFIVHNSHPLRGKWKPRVDYSDVTLNLDKEAPVPPGKWGAIVHDQDSIWMAKWIDKLTQKEKYVWLHESSPLQQSRSKAKYDNAMRVGKNLEKIRHTIEERLSSKELRERQVATVCYIIDRLGMRVGDEKDPDEADTVGASTLRVEHVKFVGNSLEFSFLGKDAVPWNKQVRPPPLVLRNLKEFTAGKSPGDEIFHEVTSGMVNSFLSSIVKGASAKVFRTYHATFEAKSYLGSKDLKGADDLEKLYAAKEANLRAAMFCNHQRTPPKTWERSLEKKEQKLAEAMAKEKPRPERIKKLEKELDFYRRTKNYNLNTSLKNYIDPRIYKAWGDYVGLDWFKVYSKSLQRKFSWVSQSRAQWDTRARTIHSA